MQIFYTDHFVLPLPDGHRFPMRKYAMLREKVEAANLSQGEPLRVPQAASDEQILRAHDAAYLRRVVSGTLAAAEIRRIGFPWTEQMVERSRRSTGATVEACRAALQHGVAVSLAGGTHHAFRDYGAGYCVFNDAAVAALAMQFEGRAKRVLIVDCDVHQGDGTAAILADDSSVFTFSIHAAKNFPFRKAESDLDVALPDCCDDATYLSALHNGLCHALSASRPDLAIYLAGADPFEDDRLGRLSLSKDGLARRDKMLFAMCADMAVPVATVMAGGYARRIEDTVGIHFSTVRFAADTYI
ncbi:MAG: histone deacetylase [Betaproteobacteria bacterium]|nr:MAG: histone deacetylase [Betaproteobacteria bacterium]